MSRRGWLAGVVVLAAGACSGGSDVTTPSTSGTNEVTVGNNFFSPTTLTVPVGTTVTWVWNPGHGPQRHLHQRCPLSDPVVG